MSAVDNNLLLHICCAPDEAWVVKSLKEQFDLFCFFSNPNIQPEPEYLKRLDEARRIAGYFNVPFAAAAYTPDLWEAAIAPFRDTPEGGLRCFHCFLLRLRETARFCSQEGWHSFTTVMSISPHKKLAILNEAGLQAANEFSVTFEPYNFKKNDGFLGSIRLSRELGIYRQDYCGCKLSRSERDLRIRSREELSRNQKNHTTTA
ncbi:MAG: epoxyqueuosine reductase QueH [Chitinivibrionales bacterium]|nr:epoxyqueuosine reductase QueH [Chitinivibrionales bacterium]